MSGDEKVSVQTYGGFYIGRYETGIAEYTSVDTTTSKNNTQNEYTSYLGGRAVIKSGQQVWNYITRDKAKKVSETLYSKTKGDSVNSKLCSSYAWDTALKFIETQVPTYPTNSAGGYYGKSALTKTGYDTTHPCNIYDMGGNVWEWTTEDYGYESYICTERGGGFDCSSGEYPAASRVSHGLTYAVVYISFRVTLYM